tara:strand:+ start:1492 stop:2133 length:642 start_codon:yes stop_codon:yes gene_type:complete
MGDFCIIENNERFIKLSTKVLYLTRIYKTWLLDLKLKENKNEELDKELQDKIKKQTEEDLKNKEIETIKNTSKNETNKQVEGELNKIKKKNLYIDCAIRPKDSNEIELVTIDLTSEKSPIEIEKKEHLGNIINNIKVNNTTSINTDKKYNLKSLNKDIPKSKEEEEDEEYDKKCSIGCGLCGDGLVNIFDYLAYKTSKLCSKLFEKIKLCCIR